MIFLKILILKGDLVGKGWLFRGRGLVFFMNFSITLFAKKTQLQFSQHVFFVRKYLIFEIFLTLIYTYVYLVCFSWCYWNKYQIWKNVVSQGWGKWGAGKGRGGGEGALRRIFKRRLKPSKKVWMFMICKPLSLKDILNREGQI